MDSLKFDLLAGSLHLGFSPNGAPATISHGQIDLAALPIKKQSESRTYLSQRHEYVQFTGVCWRFQFALNLLR